MAGDGKMVVEEAVVETYEPWTFCDIFDYATLYSDKENPILQKLAFTGRLQGDFVYFDSEGEDEYDDALWRRWRSGFKAKMFQYITVHAEAEFDLNERDPLYDRITDANVAWSTSDEFVLKIGKQSAGFTYDGATSSKELIRPERSVLSENIWFTTEYHSGVTISGDIGKWYYNLGGFSSSGGNEFGNANAGFFGLASIGYDFAEELGLDRAFVRADFVYNDEDPDNIGTRNLSQAGSINGEFVKGKFGVITDVAGAEGYGSQSDLFAVAIMPYYFITDKLQFVTSYNFVTSSGDNGVRFDRYESRVVSGRSDELHEFFAGFTYYFCGHKLKWHNGVEYTRAYDNADDGGAYDGWGLTSAVRLSW